MLNIKYAYLPAQSRYQPSEGYPANLAGQYRSADGNKWEHHVARNVYLDDASIDDVIQILTSQAAGLSDAQLSVLPEDDDGLYLVTQVVGWVPATPEQAQAVKDHLAAEKAGRKAEKAQQRERLIRQAKKLGLTAEDLR